MLEWPDATIYQGIADVCEEDPEQTALVFDGEETTYRELLDESVALARGLSSLGVDTGDRVAVWLGNRPSWVTAQLAASYLGAALVAVNTRYRTHELEYMLEDSACTALITEESFLGNDYLEMLSDVVAEVREGSPESFDPESVASLETVVALDSHDDYPAVREYDDVLDRGDESDAPSPATDPKAPATVFYTSGTTSDPKGCLQSNRSLLNHSYNVGTHLGVTAEDVGLGVLPFCGVWGYNMFMSTLTHGVPLVVQTHFDAAETLDLIDEYEVTYMSALATMLIRMRDHDSFSPERVETLERGSTGFITIGYDEQAFEELEAMLLIEAAGRVAPDVGYLLNTATMLAPRAVELFGTDAACERYLPPVLAGEELIAIAISEPGAGSDAGNIETTATPDGDDYVVNGEKTWVSVVPESSAAVVWVRFPETGLGSVIVNLDAPGVETSHEFTNMAGHTQSQLFFDDVPVPAENVLTEGPDGFAEVLAALNWERLGNAAMTNGMAAFALDSALEFAAEREQCGQPIGEFQGIEWKLADAVTDFEASRALARQAAVRAVADDRTPDRLDASIATLYSARMAERVVSEALQIHGATGYMQGHPLEYLFRLVRGWRIGAGTDEIQKNQIASALTERGLPRGY